MAIYYHGSSVLFKSFVLSHALEGDGKVKFGYGVYAMKGLMLLYTILFTVRYTN